ncbi:proton-coupled zinc antiporter SLC30A1 [Boleophthalmus pectinirostris]|uniref:proton-coupled zinc antiporter SLC30A1 n=1 Tax=Boleophthalmus pectinirostris TaxID=150288 RepID=UPI002431FCE3|nr:proton-coupled zinc antiporter SLC30A1 [Boleophthalmus pectinirostris]
MTMRGRTWTEVGLTTVLLLSEMVISQLGRSSIILLDAFHTLFMLLSTFYVPILNTFDSVKPREQPTPSPPPEACVDYRAMRAHPVGVLISNLLLLSLNTIYITEICSFVLEPAVVRRPLLLVATGTVSLTLKVFLLGLHWHHELKRSSHTEINHNATAMFEEEKTLAEQGGVFTNNKLKGCSSLLSPALTISNPNTLHSEDVTENHTNGTCDSKTPNDVQQPPPETKALPQSLLSPWLHMSETLLTPVLVLVNGLVALSMGSMCLHNSKLCGLLVYLDPMLSLLAVVLLIAKTIALVFRLGRVLLQCAPLHPSVDEVEQKIRAVPGVEAVHELHVWTLTESFTVASVHVQCCASLQSRCANIMLEVTKVLQSVGVACSTIQPEFTDQGTPHCSLTCGEACAGRMCCSLLEEQHKMKSARTKEEP